MIVIRRNEPAIFRLFLIIFLSLFFIGCGVFKKNGGGNRPYKYGWYPETYQSVVDGYKKIDHLIGCKAGETIASIGAGNGRVEVEASCFVDDLTWYLEEIDSARLYEFEKVLAYHEKLKGSAINGNFSLVLGTPESTNLPKGIFDRVIMINVYHEMSDPGPVIKEIHELLKPGGELVIMERMADEPGKIHGDCKHPKLVKSEFLKEMSLAGYRCTKQETGEQISMLIFYTFESIIKV